MKELPKDSNDGNSITEVTQPSQPQTSKYVDCISKIS